jgi:hypothetical protein
MSIQLTEDQAEDFALALLVRSRHVANREQADRLRSMARALVPAAAGQGELFPIRFEERNT